MFIFYYFLLFLKIPTFAVVAYLQFVQDDYVDWQVLQVVILNSLHVFESLQSFPILLKEKDEEITFQVFFYTADSR